MKRWYTCTWWHYTRNHLLYANLYTTGQDVAPNSVRKFGQRFGTFLSSANNDLLARGHAIYAFRKACIMPTFTVACTRFECKASASVHHDAYEVRRTLDHSTVFDDRTLVQTGGIFASRCSSARTNRTPNHYPYRPYRRWAH